MCLAYRSWPITEGVQARRDRPSCSSMQHDFTPHIWCLQKQWRMRFIASPQANWYLASFYLWCFGISSWKGIAHSGLNHPLPIGSQANLTSEMIPQLRLSFQMTLGCVKHTGQLSTHESSIHILVYTCCPKHLIYSCGKWSALGWAAVLLLDSTVGSGRDLRLWRGDKLHISV